MELTEFINNYWALIFIGLFSLIEIVPVKLSPIEFIGKRLNNWI